MTIAQAEWGGSLTGITGAFLLALNVSVSPFGWWLFLLSNLFWLRYSLLVHSRPMLLMQGVFMLINILGLYRWYYV